MYEKMEQPEQIIDNLFATGYKDRKTGRQIKLPEVKQNYALYLLRSRWQEICGEHLAKNCCIHKLEGNELVIRTANSLLANELFMMKDLFLQKINAFLLGKVIIKRLSFQAGANIETYKPRSLAEVEEAVPEPKNFTKSCPNCGVIIQSDDELCDVCKRAAKNELIGNIYELLSIQPWLDYKNCLNYYKCDKIIFTAVKDCIRNQYFERVRLGFADDKDKYMAVMLLTGKQPAEIDEKTYFNALEYLRREHYVSTRRVGLYGKKQ